MPVPPSGTMSPMPGLSGTPSIGVIGGVPIGGTPAPSGVSTPVTSAQAGQQPLKVGKVLVNPKD
jgi:hypothetical protein